MKFTSQLNIESTEKFLKTLSGHSNSEFMFCTLPDSPNAKVQPLNIQGSFLNKKEQLIRLNQLGGGIFVMINDGDGLGRKRENIKNIRAFFMDFDEEPGDVQFPLKPSIVVKTKRGKHFYWLIENKIPLEDFPIVQKQLAEQFNSDTKIHDLPRIMRLPGFLHLKDMTNPFLVQLEECSYSKYQSESFYRAFGVSPDMKVNTQEEKTSELSKKKKNSKHEYYTWVKKQSIENSSRNQTLTKILREGIALSLSEDDLKKVVRYYCKKSDLPIPEGLTVLRYQLKYHLEKPFELRYTSTIQNYKSAAQMFIDEECLSEENILKLRFWRGNFYFWEGSKYTSLSKQSLETKLAIWSHDKENFAFKFGTHAVAEIIFQLRALCLLNDKTEPNTFIDKSYTQRFISFKNGLLNLDQRAKRNDLNLISHTPNYFTFYSLNFNYKYGSSCPTWESVVERILPDEDQRELLQQWFGYHLYNNLSLQKFMVFVGEGANGKSVVTKVMSEFLGKENISSVPLEQMDIRRTFTLAAMEGKIANIVEEISETDKVSEGLLKDLVSGGTISVEKKHQDAFQMTPTAKLTFATNNLPHIKDSSHGFWRRMLVLHFNVQISESEQNPNYSNADFWISSGELSGVFEWAIAGFQSLKKYGFTDPRSSRILTEEYRLDSNPFREWLLENYEFSPNSKVSLHEIRSSYAQDSAVMARNIPSNATMKKEILRLYRTVRWSRNPILVDLVGQRRRCFIGLKSKR